MGKLNEQQLAEIRLWYLESIRNYIRSEIDRAAKELTAQVPSAKPSDAHRKSRGDGNEKTDIKKETERPAKELPLSPVNKDEELIQKIIEVIRRERKVSVSLIQRHLRVGYPRADRIMDELEFRGIVGPSRGNEPRHIIKLGIDATQQKVSRVEYTCDCLLDEDDPYYPTQEMIRRRLQDEERYKKERESGCFRKEPTEPPPF
jgi:ribosomal protein S25